LRISVNSSSLITSCLTSRGKSS